MKNLTAKKLVMSFQRLTKPNTMIGGHTLSALRILPISKLTYQSLKTVTSSIKN